MKFIPILFSSPMVQAILDNRKSMTRRTLKPMAGEQKKWLTPELLNMAGIRGYGRSHEGDGYGEWGVSLEHPKGGPLGWIKCPYGQIGDVLWVRETTREFYEMDKDGCFDFENKMFEYAADNPPFRILVDGDGFHQYTREGLEKEIPWKPSIFMPKSACRIFLQVTDVRVERLKDITVADIYSEGAITEEWISWREDVEQIFVPGISNSTETEKDVWEKLWRKINGDKSFESNPWVWVVSFKQIDKPKNFLDGKSN